MLILLTLITLGRVIFCDFTNWDDTYTVANDPGLNPPTWRALGHHWTHADMDIYMPVTQSVWAGIAYFARTASPDAAGVSLNPYAFHLVNLLAHLAAVLMVYSLLRALSFVPMAAAIGAALFAVHPVQVEPVAWISGLKDVLCGLFCLTAIRLWLTPITRMDRPMFRSLFAGLFAIMAMLSKPSGIVLPMLGIGLLLIGRFDKRAMIQLLPWAVFSVIFAVIARLSQGALNVPHPPLYQRAFIAADTIVFYLRKLIWPGSLCIDYGRTPQVVLAQSGTWRWIKLISILMLVSLGWLPFARSKHHRAAKAREANPALPRENTSLAPAVLSGSVLFLVAIGPVMGWVCFDFQEYSTVADHYLYLAMLGPAVIVAALLTRWPNRMLRGIAILWVLSLSVQSFWQCRLWTNAVTLMRHATEVNPGSWVAHLNLANALVAASPAEAIHQAQIATGLRPENPRGWSNLAAARSANHEPDKAVVAAQTAVDLRPDDPALQAALGQYADAAGDDARAIRAYRQALLHDPTNTAVMCNLAAILAEHGQKDEAEKWYQQALKQSPGSPAAKAGLVRLQKIDRSKIR